MNSSPTPCSCPIGLAIFHVGIAMPKTLQKVKKVSMLSKSGWTCKSSSWSHMQRLWKKAHETHAKALKKAEGDKALKKAEPLKKDTIHPVFLLPGCSSQMVKGGCLHILLLGASMATSWVEFCTI